MNRRPLITLIAAVLLVVPGYLWGACTVLQHAESDGVEPVFAWLSAQQDNSTGLVASQQDSNASTYNNALAVMAFVLHHEFEKAKNILDFFKNRCTAGEFYVGEDARGFFQYRDSTTGEPPCSVNRWMGDNAWLAMAIHYYKKATGDSTYDDMAATIVSLLSSFQQHPYGYISSGWERSDCERETFNSAGHAEGNLDAYKVLSLYGRKQAAAKVKMWLDYTNGLHWTDGPLDLHSWRVLSLGRSYGFCLLDMKLYERTIMYAGKKVRGYVPFRSMGKNVWSEGTGQMAVAFYRAGYKAKGDAVLMQLRRLLFEPKDHPCTLAVSYLARRELVHHPWADPAKGHVAGVCWYIFAERKFDPFEGELIQHSPPQNPIVRIEAENYDAKSKIGIRLDERGRLLEGQGIHIVGDNDVPDDDSGWTLYHFNLFSPMERSWLSLRYADEMEGDKCTILIDDEVVGSFRTKDTGTWDRHRWSEPRLRINRLLTKGPHTLKLKGKDAGTYGFSVDSIKIEKETY
jgi:hypothetical protein